MFDGLSPTMAIVVLLSYPVYVLIMAGVLGACGVSRKEIAKWALRQADRQRVTDLVRSLRPVPSGEPELARGTDPADAEPRGDVT